jgi:hypothetical protein
LFVYLLPQVRFFVQPVGDASAKALVPASPGVDLPVGRTTRELLQPLYERSLGENPVHMWTSVGGALGVTSSLGATSLETEPDLQWSVCCLWGMKVS